LSFTVKRIHGKEYEYFEFYLGGKKKSILLGVKDGSIDENAKKTILIVLKAKIFAYFRKLWHFLSRCSVSKTCQCLYHGYVYADEIKKMKRIVNRLEKKVSKISAKKSASPLITVIYRDNQGYHQIRDVCITCLYRRLLDYCEIGVKREPKKLGILFLNDDIGFSF